MQVQGHDEDYNEEEMALFDKPDHGYSNYKPVTDDDKIHDDKIDEVDDDGYGLAQFFEGASHYTARDIDEILPCLKVLFYEGNEVDADEDMECVLFPMERWFGAEKC